MARLKDDFSNLGDGTASLHGRVVLAIDPGVVSGWAYCGKDGKPHASGTIGKAGHKIDTGEYLDALFAIVQRHGHPHVILYEDLIIVPGRQRSLPDARPRIAVEAFAHALGSVPWQSIYPATWKAHYKFPAKNADPLLSVKLVGILFPMVQLANAKAHDQADAVLMAAYYSRVINAPPLPRQLDIPAFPKSKTRSKWPSMGLRKS